MPKVLHRPIESQRVRLRLLEEGDIEMIRLWRNQDNIRCWFKFSDLIDCEQQKRWFAQYEERDNDYLYIIEKKSNSNCAIGQIGIYNIDFSLGTAEYGRILIGDSTAQNQGLAKESSELMIDYWKKKFDIGHLTLQVRESNMRAIALYNKLGFRKVQVDDGYMLMALNQTSSQCI